MVQFCMMNCESSRASIYQLQYEVRVIYDRGASCGIYFCWGWPVTPQDSRCWHSETDVSMATCHIQNYDMSLIVLSESADKRWSNSSCDHVIVHVAHFARAQISKNKNIWITLKIHITSVSSRDTALKTGSLFIIEGLLKFPVYEGIRIRLTVPHCLHIALHNGGPEAHAWFDTWSCSTMAFGGRRREQI